MNKKGFTLIELLVMVAIVGLLVVLAYTALLKSRLESCATGNSTICEKMKMTSSEAKEELDRISDKKTTEEPAKEESKVESYSHKKCRTDCAKDEKKVLIDCLTRCDIIYEE
jgi:prepilin-type N-terminal cleavage/methylation domain-containing protein